MPLQRHLEDIKERLRGREIEVLRQLGIDWPPQRGRSHINCPFPDHSDKAPSWRWDKHKSAWFCTCGGGDLISAVQRKLGRSFPEALAFICEALGLADLQRWENGKQKRGGRSPRVRVL